MRPTKVFKAYDPGYVHVDVKYLPQMPGESQRRYLFVAIDRATRWVYAEIRPNKTAASARRFLKALHARCPIKIRCVLTDNGKEFTDRLFGLRKRAESGTHEFDALCAALDIEHRLTRPKTPQTNGMVERFNGRISHVLNTNRFESGEDLEQTLTRYIWLYNHHLPQKALNHETLILALKRWQSTRPELFVKQVRDRPGPNILGVSDDRVWRVIEHCIATARVAEPMASMSKLTVDEASSRRDATISVFFDAEQRRGCSPRPGPTPRPSRHVPKTCAIAAARPRP